MGMGIGALALLVIAGTADAKKPKAPKPGKIRAEAMLGEDGPRLHEFVQWRAIPLVDGGDEEEPAPAEDAPEPEAEAPVDEEGGEEAPAEEEEEDPGPPPIELGGGKLDGLLPPGRYRFEAEVAPFVKAQEIEVRAGKRLNLDVVFEGAFVEYAPKNAPETFTCGATNGRFEDEFSASSPTRRFFEPGIWEVTCNRGVLSTGSVIKLNHTNMVKITPDLSVGRLEAGVINDDEYSDKVYFEIRDVNPDGPASAVAVYAEKSEALAVDLPPGTYEVFAKMAYTRPLPDFIGLEGTGRATIEIGQTSTVELDIPWAQILPQLDIGRRARKPLDTRWFVRNPADLEGRPHAVRLQPEGTPFTIHAFEEPIVVEVHDEYDRVVGRSAPFVPTKHAVTEVSIPIRR